MKHPLEIDILKATVPKVRTGLSPYLPPPTNDPGLSALLRQPQDCDSWDRAGWLGRGWEEGGGPVRADPKIQTLQCEKTK